MVVRASFGVSLDGFMTGVDQTRKAPFGQVGFQLIDWNWKTRTFQLEHGDDPDAGGPTHGTVGVDNAFAQVFLTGVGAEIMGAGKFGPPGWEDDPEWRGWWGPNPPFHAPTFVLTHSLPRDPIEMEGGTTFHFVSGTPQEVLALATEAAGDKDVLVGGGPTMGRAYIAAGVVDCIHVTLTPIVVGRGTRLWDGLEGFEKDYDVEMVPSPLGIVHITFTRRS